MKFFKNKNTSIRSSQGYSDVAAPGAGGSDPAVGAPMVIGAFFLLDFHTPPVTTPVLNLGHVLIHKITGSCIYYCIVNT